MLVSLAVWGTAALVLWARTGGVAGRHAAASGSSRRSASCAWTSAMRDADRGERGAVPAVRAAGLPDRAVHPRRLRHAEDGRPRRAALVPGSSSAGSGGGVAGSVWNGLVALGGMALLFIVSLPLWLLPPLWPLIPLAIFAWVNQRLLRYDALAEHADRGEMTRIFRERPRRRCTCWACCSRCWPTCRSSASSARWCSAWRSSATCSARCDARIEASLWRPIRTKNWPAGTRAS